MAEGGNFSRTIIGGSDVLSDRECAQCLADHSKQEATHVCQVCKQYLCQTCGRYHIRNMTNHSLVSVELFSQSAVGSPSPFVAKCHYHPDRDIEMYCGTHDMVYCSLCVAKGHRSCRDVKEAGEMAHTALLSTLQSLVADIAVVNTQLLHTKLEKSNDIQNLKTKKAKILQEINEVREQMNNHLDALEHAIIAKLDAEENQLEKEINAEIKVIEDLMTAFDKQKPDLTCNYNGNQMYIIAKLGRAVLADANTVLEKAKSLINPSLEFKRNEVLCDVIEQSDSIGQVIRKYSRPAGTNLSKYFVKSVHEKNVRVTSDEYCCCISGMCLVSDGTFMLTDYSNKRLKKLSKQFKVNKFRDFKTKPLGLCSVSTNEVAIGLDGENLAFSHIDNQNLFTHKRTALQNLFKAEWGMACCSGHIWIPCIGAVCIYSLDGSLVKKVETDTQGRKIFSECGPYQIAVNKNETKVYVAAGGDRVVAFRNNGDFIGELHDQQLNRAHGVCITEDDVVLVAGYSSNNIVMFDKDGNNLGALISGYETLVHPLTLCYDRQECRVLVGFEWDQILVLELNK